MKERLTFLVSRPEDTRPENCMSRPAELKILALPKATREDRYTIDFASLPAAVKLLLRNIDQGHLIWSSGSFHVATPPFAARVPAGLHIMTSPGWFESVSELFPAEEGKEKTGRAIDDSFLAAAWGLGAWGGNKTANMFKIGPWAQTFYSPVDSISPFWKFMHKAIDNYPDVSRTGRLEWMRKLDRLISADYLDIQYDVASQKFEVSTYWGPSDVDWSGWMVGDPEIGVLGVDKAPEEEEESVKLAGYIYDVAGGEPGEATMFSFPSRHHRAQSDFTLTTNTPTGLHPTLRLTIPGPPAPPREDAGCTLNAYFTLPAPVFVDKYQLSTNANSLEQLGLRRLRDVTGSTDLEAPEYSLPAPEWGSRVLIELSTEGFDGEPLEAELPLHTRYMRPGDNSTAASVTIPWPSVFWACNSDIKKEPDANPFDRTGLGWEDLFPENAVYYHLSPVPVAGERANGSWAKIPVPVLDSANASVIQMGTVVAVGLGFVVVSGVVLWARLTGGKKTAKEAKKMQ